MNHSVLMPDGTHMPSLGMGTWHMGDDRSKHSEELESLLVSLSCGIRLIDTAEMYGDGAAEQLVGEALRHAGDAVPRDELFVVSKVLPSNAGHRHIRDSVEASLARLGLDYLDLYLLHWRGDVPLAETVECMEQLLDDGLIRRWGVSNCDVEDMDELMCIPESPDCATNQVLYHLGSRGVEVALKPWMRAHHMPMMAYCPLAQGGTLTQGLLEAPSVVTVAQRHGATPAQVLLAWVMRDGATVAIPKASTPEHARQNAAAAQLGLTTADLAELDEAFPAPQQREPLDWL